jgi:hypothetical protein
MFYRISGVLVGMGVYMSLPTRRDAWQARSPGLRIVDRCIVEFFLSLQEALSESS